MSQICKMLKVFKENVFFFLLFYRKVRKKKCTRMTVSFLCFFFLLFIFFFENTEVCYIQNNSLFTLLYTKNRSKWFQGVDRFAVSFFLPLLVKSIVDGIGCISFSTSSC